MTLASTSHRTPKPNKLPALVKLCPGMVCTHEDGRRVHFAIVLKVHTRTCICLFFTSKPRPDSRRLTKDEAALAGFYTQRWKPTYLSKVDRAKSELVPRGPVFPEHRVAELREEFGV